MVLSMTVRVPIFLPRFAFRRPIKRLEMLGLHVELHIIKSCNRQVTVVRQGAIIIFFKLFFSLNVLVLIEERRIRVKKVVFELQREKSLY
jgi:hypothetical protein